MTDAEALERARIMAGKLRQIAGKYYMDGSETRHEALDRLMLDILRQQGFTQTAEFIASLKVWYG